jgi:hypothetical protein
MHLPAFGEINTTYEKKVPSARASIDDTQQNAFSEQILSARPEKHDMARRWYFQNGLTTAKSTIPIIKTVGSSLIMR